MSPPAPVDFLGIGAQRSATTWLANCLRTHPEVWLPPRKELHYFSRDPKYPSAVHLTRGRTLLQAVRLLPTSSWIGRRMRRDIRRAIGQRSIQDLRWVLRYYLSEPDDDWYLSLFARGAGKVAGEITPDYSMLDLDDVRRVHNLAPDLRLIFIMRNPIDRAWSQVRLHLGRSDLEAHHAAEFIEFIDSDSQTLRSDYVRTLTNWRTVFGRDQMLVGYYDEIVDDADRWLRSLARYLDISPDGFGGVSPINAAVAVAIPEAVRAHLCTLYEPMLHRLLIETSGSAVVQSWIDSLET